MILMTILQYMIYDEIFTEYMKKNFFTVKSAIA